MSKVRDNRKKNLRLNWQIAHNPAVAALYPAWWLEELRKAGV